MYIFLGLYYHFIPSDYFDRDSVLVNIFRGLCLIGDYEDIETED